MLLDLGRSVGSFLLIISKHLPLFPIVLRPSKSVLDLSLSCSLSDIGDWTDLDLSPLSPNGLLFRCPGVQHDSIMLYKLYKKINYYYSVLGKLVSPKI